MSIEITEFVPPKARFGSMLPLAPLPHQAHSKIAAAAAAYQLNARTAMIAVLPDVDIRIRVADSAAGAVADATCPILKSGVLREFEVTGGHWLHTVAA